MFIIKFNNMVRNKRLWGAFALLVAVAFGASDIWSSASRGAGERERIGLLDGSASIRYPTYSACEILLSISVLAVSETRLFSVR